jgi:hypothetical protein
LLFSASVALSYARSSSAETVDSATRAAARELGEEGMRLYDKGDCAGAVEKLARAHDLVHVPTLALYAGKCLEKMGRLVDASERYLEATRDPVEAGAPPAQRAAQADAERARKALLPRLASVELVLAPPAPDAVVTLDGRPMPPAMLGIRRPIDPGSHSVEVQRAGAVTTRSFSMKEAESQRIQVEAPAAGPPVYGSPSAYPPSAYPLGAYPPGAYPLRYVPAPATRRQSTALFVTGVVLIPVGTVAGIAGVLVVATNPEAPAGGYALLGLGLLGLGGGIAMTVVGGKRVPVEAPPSVSFEPLIGPTSAGLRVRF